MSENDDRNSAAPQGYDDLRLAAQLALVHLQDLREAWRTGAIRECDGKGGERSNRNVEAEVRLRLALESSGAAS